jgi:hypothetical protein
VSVCVPRRGRWKQSFCFFLVFLPSFFVFFFLLFFSSLLFFPVKKRGRERAVAASFQRNLSQQLSSDLESGASVKKPKKKAKQQENL